MRTAPHLLRFAQGLLPATAERRRRCREFEASEDRGPGLADAFEVRAFPDDAIERAQGRGVEASADECCALDQELAHFVDDLGVGFEPVSELRQG